MKNVNKAPSFSSFSGVKTYGYGVLWKTFEPVIFYSLNDVLAFLYF